jgi:hypothetical protein
MTAKKELIVFSNFRLGGMKSYYENILANIPKTNNFDIHWYLVDYTFDKDAPRPESLPNCVPSSVFEYYPEDNIYKASDRLERLISNTPGVVITNNELELATLHLHRKPNKTIVFVCHDDLYLPIAEKFEFLIDIFVAHNNYYYEKLITLFPRRVDNIYFLPYGVMVPELPRVSNFIRPLEVIFVSRLYESKGIKSLPVIHQQLYTSGILVKWRIIGKGPEKEYLLNSFRDYPEVSFFAPKTNAGVLEHLQQSDVFILPSKLDGLPVALLEAMSVGCVPVISEFNTGIKQVVSELEGFVLPVGDDKKFADTIKELHYDREKLEDLSARSRSKVQQEYEVGARALEYYNFYYNIVGVKRKKKRKLILYAGYLNFFFMPDWIKKLLRSIKKINV